MGCSGRRQSKVEVGLREFVVVQDVTKGEACGG